MVSPPKGKWPGTNHEPFAGGQRWNVCPLKGDRGQGINLLGLLLFQKNIHTIPQCVHISFWVSIR